MLPDEPRALLRIRERTSDPIPTSAATDSADFDRRVRLRAEHYLRFEQE
jgi:hypothetical protein